MSEKEPDKYDKVQSKIEKKINPYITVKIPLPEGADKDAFLKLESNKEFIEFLKNQTSEWLSKGKSAGEPI